MTLPKEECREIIPEPLYENIRDFEDLLLLVGSTGRRNILLFIICSLGALTNPLVLFTYTFLGATPDHWCNVDGLSNTSWTLDQIKNISVPLETRDGLTEYSRCDQYDLDYDSLKGLPFEEAYRHVNSLPLPVVQCDSRRFEDFPDSVVTQWDLVCSRRVIYSTIQSGIQSGILLGCLLFGYALDRFGRYSVYRVCVCLHVLVGVVLSFSPVIETFIFLKAISAMTGIGIYMAGFVLALEFTTCSQRSLVATYSVIPWSFGIMLSATISYMVRPWYYLQLALTAPTALLLIGVWFIPESPRWLILNGKHEEAYKVLSIFAKSNGKPFPKSGALFAAMTNIQTSQTPSNPSTNKRNVQDMCIDVMKRNATLLARPELRPNTLKLFFCWFSSSLIYYSISLGSPALGTSDYLFIFLGGAVELVAYLILWPAVVYLGRKHTLVVTFYTCSVTIVTAMVLVICVARNEMIELKLCLFLAGKCAITANFHLLWIYTAELYSTQYRSLAVGQASTMARLGSICSPYINDMLGQAAAWAPSGVFGLLSVLAGSLSINFRETANQELDGPQTNKKGIQEPFLDSKVAS